MVRIGELLGLTWDCVDISEEAISENRAYVFINKQVERVSKEAVEELDSKEVILIFPSQRKNNKTVRVLKTPKTDTSERKVYIPGFVAQCLIDIKKEQDEVKEALGSEYTDYNLIMATTFGMPINGSYIRDQMQKVIDKEGLPDVVFHSLRHTSVTYKLKLSGGDIKAVFITDARPAALKKRCTGCASAVTKASVVFLEGRGRARIRARSKCCS